VVKTNQDVADGFDQFAKRTTALIRHTHIKKTAHAGLVTGFGICPVARHEFFERFFGAASGFRVGGSQGSLADATAAAKGFNRGEEPGFIFPKGNNNIARRTGGGGLRPSTNIGGKFHRAIVLAIEQDDNGGTFGLEQRQSDGGFNIRLFAHLRLGAANGTTDRNMVTIRLGQQTPE
jgi:hypothetical protein